MVEIEMIFRPFPQVTEKHPLFDDCKTIYCPLFPFTPLSTQSSGVAGHPIGFQGEEVEETHRAYEFIASHE